MKNKRQNRTGFTLVEIMAVIIIIGLLAAIGAVNFLGQTDKARVTTTRANLKMLDSAVAQFKMDTGQYPDEEQGLLELIEEPTDIIGWQPGGYLNTTELPRDAWSNEFDYIRYPESGRDYVIVSYGADGQEGGEDYDTDLYSTDAY
ncbi:MAG: type II secretion system major pseudopilin GspG [Anaerohalosphaeraceae bacterium]|nr:type II secretion system major pseudopilin GspG [Anaerohalosphaeraceae bacterium]